MIPHTRPVTGYNKYGAKSTHMRPLLKAATIYATNATAMGPAVYLAERVSCEASKAQIFTISPKTTDTHTLSAHTYSAPQRDRAKAKSMKIFVAEDKDPNLIKI